MSKVKFDIDESVWDDMDGMVEWYKEEYASTFEPYFKDVHTLYQKLSSDKDLITDAELEMVLIDLPLNMFSVAESLNAFKLQSEVIKLKIKEIKRDTKKESKATTATERNEEAEAAAIELEILLKGFNAVIDRVDRESTFCKELIMSAKKVWSARRQFESDAHIMENTTSQVNDLPDYKFEETM